MDLLEVPEQHTEYHSVLEVPMCIVLLLTVCTSLSVRTEARAG